jgi:putative hydrolase of HD superfamily
MLDFFIRALQLKNETRTGWVLRGVHDPESVADHSWGSAYLCLLYAAEAGVDRARAVEMALVHDLAEAVTGDVATRVVEMNDKKANADKRSREAAAMDELTAVEAGTLRLVRELWEEYEAGATPAARFVRDMNMIDMCAQALTYETSRRYDTSAENSRFPDFAGMDEFFATTHPRLTTAVGRRLFDELRKRYELLEAVRERGGMRLDPEPEGTDD